MKVFYRVVALVVVIFIWTAVLIHNFNEEMRRDHLADEKWSQEIEIASKDYYKYVLNNWKRSQYVEYNDDGSGQKYSHELRPEFKPDKEGRRYRGFEDGSQKEIDERLIDFLIGAGLSEAKAKALIKRVAKEKQQEVARQVSIKNQAEEKEKSEAEKWATSLK
jgi:hypothetical protein